MSEDQARRIALKVNVAGQTHEITFDELTLSNNLGLEALVTLLVEKGIFKPEELQGTMDRIRRDRYRGPNDPKE
jgi:hypothetical protein